MNETEDVPISEFSNYQFPGDVIIRSFGEVFVSKTESNCEHDGDKTIFQLWQSNYHVSANQLIYGLIHNSNTNVVYKNYIPRFQPYGTAFPTLDKTRKSWNEIHETRLRTICETVFPESKEGYISGDYSIKIIKGNRLTTWDLDDIEDQGISLEKYLNFKITHDIFGRAGVLVKLGDKFAVRWRMPCHYCHKRIVEYTHSGCHKGAYCYACDKSNNYLADLRNQCVVCSKCGKGKHNE